MSTTVWIVLGPPEHGVVVLAQRICRQLDLSDSTRAECRVISAGGIDELLSAAALTEALGAGRNQPGPSVHVHFTDQLFGTDCAAAAAAYRKLASLVSEAHGGELSATLHDLPMATDEPHRFRRRADAYRRVVAATSGAIIVSSTHEASLLAALSSDVAATVIPLPLEALSRSQHRCLPATPGDVAILGFLHPESGHAEVLEAMAWLPDEVGLTALGRVADGHQALAADLRRRARELGRRFDVTGWIEAHDLPSALRRAGIPIVGPRHISASASIGSWLAAGRRPLVPDLPYTRELIDRIPNSLNLYPASVERLIGALRGAHADPSSTWLPTDVVLGPSTSEVAARYHNAVSGRSAAGSR